MNAHKGFITLAAAIAVAMGVPSCAHTVTGTAVAEQTAASFIPNPPTTTSVPTKAPSEMTTDELVRTMVEESVAYWNERGAGVPPQTVVGDSGPASCGVGSDPFAQACQGTVHYSIPGVQHERETLGQLAVFEGLAHEVGHAVQHATDTNGDSINEQETRADCASGAVTAMQHVTLDRAVSVFNQTAMYNADGQPTKAFTVGFNTQRNGGDTLSVCTTYEYK